MLPKTSSIKSSISEGRMTGGVGHAEGADEELFLVLRIVGVSGVW